MKTGTGEEPLKFSEARKLRKEALHAHKEFHESHGGGEYKAPEFTCSTCVMLAWCEYAYDLYNTNGDCLASK